MGQYYYGVIRQKENREVIAASYCCKLVESNRADLLYLAYALSKKGVGYMQRVCWVGDYSDLKDSDGKNLYQRLNDKEWDLPAWVPEVDAHSPYGCEFSSDKAREDAYEKFNKFRKEWFCSNIVTGEYGRVRDELRYICNHDRKEYFDILAIKPTDSFENPLAVLTSDPTCRISGGGDYCYQDNYKMYAAWYDCVLSAEEDVPEGYTAIDPNFGTTMRIWDYDGLRRGLYGERGYDAPYPHYSEFYSYLSHGRYQEFQDSLCVMPMNELKAVYAKWYQNLDLERVFKAYDAIARVLKHDPHLTQEHKGVSFRVTDYDLHYLDCDGVSVCIYQERKNSPWKVLDTRADYNGMRYSCDRKSRAFHRRRLEAIRIGFYDAA